MATKVVQIEIQAGNVIKEPDLFSCNSDDQIVFLVINNDNVDHWVKVDTKDIIFYEDKPPAPPPGPLGTPPWKGGKQDVKVNKAGTPAAVDLIKGHSVKDKSNFGKNKPLPYTTYGYTIISGNDAQYQTFTQLDPGFVITPP